MPDHPGFLQAIGDEPEDDTPRLIYADWLEDHGESERAEFIRLQCHAATLPWDEERDALEDRANDLLDRCEGIWLGSLAEVLTDWRFARGFLEYARLPCERFLDCVDDLVRTGPTCRVRMMWETGVGNMSAVMRWPELERVTSLDLTEMLTEPGCTYLARSSFVKRLRHLDVSGTETLRLPARTLQPDPFPLADLGALSSNSSYEKLRSLCCNARQVGNRGVKALASSGVLTNLRSLSLNGNPITDKGVRSLANSASLANLTALNLQIADVTASSVDVLAKMLHLRDLSLSPRPGGSAGNTMLSRLSETGLLGRLDRLALRFENTEERNLEALIEYGGSSQLKELSLNGGLVEYQTLLSIAAAPLLETVERLDLSRTGFFMVFDLPAASGSLLFSRLRALSVSSANLEGHPTENLAYGGSFSRLRFLALSSNRITSDGLSAILAGLENDRLRSLKLADNPLQDGGLERLAAAPGLGRLRELDLSRTGATAEGVQQLLASTTLPRLRVLRLSGTDLDGLNVEELLESPVVAGLRMLDLSSTRRLTGDDIDDLKDALGRRVNLQYAGDDC